MAERQARRLEEHREHAEREEAERAARVAVHGSSRAQVDAWVARNARASKGLSAFDPAAKKKKKPPVGDLRKLLRHLHEAVPSLAKPGDFAGVRAETPAAEVKRAYRRALVLCHPDKQHGASVEDAATAGLVFEALRAAHAQFGKR